MSERVTGLFPGVRYLFRLCGRDEGATDEACAQTRAFTTPGPPGRDSLSAGWWHVYPHAYRQTLRAESGPRGESPTGTLTHTNPQEFQGRVTCLEVGGQRAVVGVTASSGVSRLYAFDAQAKTGALATSPVSTPPTCRTATFGAPQDLPNGFVGIVDVR